MLRWLKRDSWISGYTVGYAMGLLLGSAITVGCLT